MKKQLLLTVLSLAFAGLLIAQDRVLADFESGTTPFWSDAVITTAVVANPDASGINTSAQVLQVEKDSTDTGWYFITTNFAPQWNFISHPVLSFKVYATSEASFNCRVDNDRWQQQFFSNEYVNGASAFAVDAGSVGTWVEFTVDFSRYPSNRYVSLAFGIAIGSADPGLFYFDDITLVERATPITENDRVNLLLETFGPTWAGSWYGYKPFSVYEYALCEGLVTKGNETVIPFNMWEEGPDATPGFSNGAHLRMEKTGEQADSIGFYDLATHGFTELELSFNMAWWDSAAVATIDPAAIQPHIEFSFDGGAWATLASGTGFPTENKVYTTVTAPIPQTGDLLSFRIINDEDYYFYLEDVIVSGKQSPLSTGVTVTADGGITELPVGASVQMSATVEPAGARQDVSWSIVSGPADVAITTGGLMSSTAELGETIIRATANDGTGNYGEYSITVSPIIVLVEFIEVTSPFDTIGVEEEMQMTAVVTPATASDPTVTWSVDNTSVGIILGTGLLTGVGQGVVTVTATANDGSGVTGAKEITIGPGVGTDEALQNAPFTVFPNPAKDFLNVTGAGSVRQIDIISLDGRLVNTIQNDGGDYIKVDLTGFTPGNYLIRLTTVNDRVFSGSFIVQ